MFICLDCGRIFSEAKHYVDTHGLERPPYEEYDGCPKCAGAYADAYRCECCNDWISDKYIKIGDKRYCDNCYIYYELGEE